MLFKFASYLLGTNTEQDDPQTAAPPSSGPPLSNHPDDHCNNSASRYSLNASSAAESTESIDVTSNAHDPPTTRSNEYAESGAELIYDERFVQTDDRPERLEDSLHEDDEQWIYITPIRVNTSQSDDLSLQPQDESLDSVENAEVGEQFNMFELFNKARATTVGRAGGRNKLEESWVIHPPACFQVDNTFAIEQHPLENLYIEQPALSVISAKRAAAAAVAKAISAASSNSGSACTKDNKENSTPKSRNMRKATRRNCVWNKECNTRKNGRSRAKAAAKSQDGNNRNGSNSNANGVNNASVPMMGSNGPVNMNTLEAMTTGTTTTTGATSAAGIRSAASGRNRSASHVHPATMVPPVLCPSSAYRRERILSRPFTIHRKLC